MIKKLIVEKFVLIDRLELELLDGLTILTGETGAGKSIILGAMGLILGDESNPRAIRQGEDQAVIEAILTPNAGHSAWKFMIEKGLAAEGQSELTIKRVIGHEGDIEIAVNGKAVELALLQELGERLIEIHGQFANQSISDPQNQLDWLDASGGFDQEYFDNVASAFHEVNRRKQELEDEKTFIAEHQRNIAAVDKVVTSLEEIGMEDGLPAHIEAEYERLLTAKETSETFQAILSQLVASNGAVFMLSSVNQIFKKQENFDDEKVGELQQYLSAALTNARDAVTEMRRLIPEYEIDTGPIHECEDKLAIMRDISARYKVSFEDLNDFYMEQVDILERVRNGKENLKQMEDDLIRAKNAYRHHAHILTEKRIEAGRALSRAITSELPPLKLNKAEFEVVVNEGPEIPWTARGFNTVVYTARMNPGMPFSPIADTASGGELARMILAIKVILQGVQTTPTLVFDEVDTGIGGPAAAAVGERLALLSDKTQILVITHSPQVASRGRQHLHVSKSTDGTTTVSTVKTLDENARIDEISRMLAGDKQTEHSRAAAQSLIQEAKDADAVRHKAVAPSEAVNTTPPENEDVQADALVPEQPDALQSTPQPPESGTVPQPQDKPDSTAESIP